ncbi:MAG: hypothetical protein PHT48_09520 [Dechloromonas sp.]|nr:hypothetical protein [Dechloromonas sp.]
MSIGTVTPYNQAPKILLSDAGRQWDDAAAGSLFFCLADENYTPSLSHTTTNDVGAALITAGDGVAIPVTGAAIDDTTEAGSTFLQSDHADFGVDVTITAKYLICVQPVTANTFSATTSNLLWYVDLDDATTSATVSSNPDFAILQPVNGWIKLAKLV